MKSPSRNLWSGNTLPCDDYCCIIVERCADISTQLNPLDLHAPDSEIQLQIEARGLYIRAFVDILNKAREMEKREF